MTLVAAVTIDVAENEARRIFDARVESGPITGPAPVIHAHVGVSIRRLETFHTTNPVIIRPIISLKGMLGKVYFSPFNQKLCDECAVCPVLIVNLR
jgi:hypothetical protein